MKTHCQYGTPTYLAWAAMKRRCDNPNQQNYYLYGGRGISYCKKWKTFEGFYEDMGGKPISLSLDRKDNDAGYCKDNCRWADSITQANNKRSNRIISAFGKFMTLAKWSKLTGIGRTTITNRIDYYGWKIKDALVILRRANKKIKRPLVISGIVNLPEYHEAKLGHKHKA